MQPVRAREGRGQFAPGLSQESDLVVCERWRAGEVASNEHDGLHEGRVRGADVSRRERESGPEAGLVELHAAFISVLKEGLGAM